MAAETVDTSVYRNMCVYALQSCRELKKLPSIQPENLQKIQELITTIEGIFKHLEEKSYQLILDRAYLIEDREDLEGERARVREDRRLLESEQAKLKDEKDRVGTIIAAEQESHAAELRRVVDLYNVSLQKEQAQRKLVEAQLKELQSKGAMQQ